ncbi:hypothetical protein Vadar_006824 [Vaccinium darrowii]|uniref:Uncharacterized protein n=1 Tax=Vaccinium darrowii TaxID=229202 RepID=A0ACB7ZC25_9ERIC|nr:hypothetical protein Vadar_006824 [Vaccinium darrowii]
MKKITRTKGEDRERANEELLEIFKLLEGELRAKPYFAGDEFGLVDIAMVPFRHCNGAILQQVLCSRDLWEIQHRHEKVFLDQLHVNNNKIVNEELMMHPIDDASLISSASTNFPKSRSPDKKLQVQTLGWSQNGDKKRWSLDLIQRLREEMGKISAGGLEEHALLYIPAAVPDLVIDNASCEGMGEINQDLAKENKKMKKTLMAADAKADSYKWKFWILLDDSTAVVSLACGSLCGIASSSTVDLYMFLDGYVELKFLSGG